MIKKSLRSLLCLFLCTIAMHLLPIKVLAQTTDQVTIKSNSITLLEVFKLIQKQTGLIVFYNNDLLSDSEKIAVDFERASVDKVLQTILKGKGLEWQLRDKNIVLQKTKTNPVKTVGQAQDNFITGEVSGTVTEATGKHDILTGVSVSIKGTKQMVVTNELGNYFIPGVAANATLVFSYMGFQPMELRVNGRKRIDVELNENLSNLNEVVIVGYGTQKKRDLTASIGSVSAEQMDRYPSGNVNTSLQGKIAGLQITTNSGEPGGGATVRIRGASSISGGNQPLYIIDGMPVNADSFGASDDGTATFSPLSDINPADIESVEVLKDGAAASIYGSRATNGVIIITTKSGKGREPEISVAVNTSLADVTRRVGVLNAREWRSAYIEGYYNLTGLLTDKVSVIDSLHPYYSNSRNWQDIMFRESVQYKADVSVRGGSDKMNYFASFGYYDLKPVIIATDYKQFTGSANLDYKIGKYISGKTSFKLSNYNYSRIKTGSSSFSVIFQAFSTMPVYSPYDPYTGEIIALFEGSKRSPLAIATYATNDIKRWRMLGRQEINVKVHEKINIQTSIGIDYDNNELSSYNPPILNTNESSNRSMVNPSTNYSWINENVITYTDTFNEKHHLNFLIGQSLQKYNRNSLSLTGSGSIDNLITSIGGAATILNFGQNLSQNILLSYFARANYDFKSRYLLSLTLRRDGSSRFGAGKRVGYFPAASIGWRFSDEPFLKDSKVLYDGKIRASFGVTGNQDIGNYVAQGAVANAGTYLGNLALISSSVPNQNLKWENTQQSDIGLDLSFFKGRLDFMADVYGKETRDLLFNVQVPGQTGYGSLAMNYGSILNKGLEITIGGRPVDHQLKWDSRLIFGMNRNEVLELPDGRDYRPNSYSLARVGQPIGVFYGLRALGVYANDADNVYKMENGTVIPFRKGSSTGQIYKGGDVIWEDLNKDGIINDSDQQIIGNPNPKFAGGFSNDFTYGSFKLSIFFNYNFGNKVYNLIRSTLDASTNDSNFSTDQLRRWRKQGDITDIPRLVKSDPMQNNAVSSRFVEDGSFIRLQNIGLSYRLPTSLVSKVKMKNADIGLNIANLLTWSKYSGFDPEVSSSSNPLGFGADDGAFPKTTSYNFSLNIKF